MKKIVKGILLVPLILIAVVLITVFVVFIISSYKVEYGADEYQISQIDYADLERFTVNGSYKLLVADRENLPIAEKFNGYIEKIIGKKLDVVTGKNGSPYIELTVKPDLKDDCVFSGDNKNITICADDKDHLLRGAYAFLEEFGGVRCYTSKLITFTADSIFFPKKEGGYTKTYNSYFEMLDTDWISPKDDEYSWFRGFNTDEYRYEVQNQDIAAETAGCENNSISIDCDSVAVCISCLYTVGTVFINKDFFDSGVKENGDVAGVDVLFKQRNNVCTDGDDLAFVIDRAMDTLDRSTAESGNVVESDADGIEPLDAFSGVFTESLDEFGVVDSLTADHGVELHEFDGIEVSVRSGLICIPLLFDDSGELSDEFVVSILFSRCEHALNAGSLIEFVGLLPLGLSGVHAAGGADGVTSDHALAFNDDDVCAEVGCSDGSGHTCAACTDNNNVCSVLCSTGSRSLLSRSRHVILGIETGGYKCISCGTEECSGSDGCTG